MEALVGDSSAAPSATWATGLPIMWLSTGTSPAPHFRTTPGI
jgi:hypothetical protein